MENSKYSPRVIDEVIKKYLRTSGGVLIEGPKWCGKTTTAIKFSKSQLMLGDPDEFARASLLSLGDVKSLLNGTKPRLIDEWQTFPALWDAARFEIDKSQNFGQYIFTGSAVPNNNQPILHSGTGRFTWIRMRPMSLYESGDSTGEVSLTDLFNNKPIHGESNLTAKKLAYVTCRGGFPASLRLSQKDALTVPRTYKNGIIHSDLPRLDGIKRSPEYIASLLRSYARFQGEQVALTEIRKDMGSITGETPSINTVLSYHDSLKKIFVIEDAPAWNPNLRSKTAIRTSDTRYFVDPSIAVASLETDPDGLLEDLSTFGFIFETLCMRDLRVYADALDGKISHYRDHNGLECDAVIHLYGGKYGLIQFKLGGSPEEIEDAAAKMKNLANIVDDKKTKKPSFMMILTGVHRLAYRREDGVYVVPIGCLKP
ncbi:ATP-binding protein [Candidatus Saccharibacteria bacterium]|nr:ATP-binding protein [Candidatus Saccharibacteria bacterium]